MKVSRLISLFIVIALIAALIIGALSSGQSMMYWFVLFSPMIALFLFSIWYAIFGWGSRKKRLKIGGILFLVFLLISIGIGALTRYEGSTSGASLPRLVWKWSKKEQPQANIETRINEAAVDQTIEEEAASVSTNFFGPDRDGMWGEAEFSFDWSTNPPVELWRRPIGQGWSSFAIANGRAITIEKTDGGEQTTCVDLLTGKNIWTNRDDGVDFIEAKEGEPGAVMGGEGPRSTPEIYSGKVYVAGSTGIAKCIDFDSGKTIWSRNIIEENGGKIPEWGKASSPLILEEQQVAVFTGPDHPGATLVALDLATGEPKWIYKGNGASYSSPRLISILGKPQIVSVNQVDVTGVDPDTGKELWNYSWPGSFPKVCQPMPIGENRVLITASYPGVKSALLELTESGGKWEVSEVWQSTRMKTKFSSAVILGDHVYGIDEGRLASIVLETGNKAWKNYKTGFGQQFLIKDHLLIQTEPGPVVLGKPTPEGFTEKAKIDALSAMTWNSPALAGRFLLVRNDREAVCYLLPRK